ncbi:unnamed protein product, partial [Prorocentrum cordatum]
AVLAQARRGLAGLRQGGAMDGCGPGGPRGPRGGRELQPPQGGGCGGGLRAPAVAPPGLAARGRRGPLRSVGAAEGAAGGLGGGLVQALAILRETRLGALNRLKAARSTAAGAAADFCIAFEGGVEADDTGRLVCFAVVCAQYRDDAYVSEVHSASHSLPPGLQAMMEQEGLELGVATDRFFEERIAAGYGKNTGGTIGALTHGIIDRVEFYTQPGMLALVPFMNAAAYGIVAGNPLDRPART